MLRRILRRVRTSGPSEQQWLRLILLVRRLQRGQIAFAQRLDEVRALSGVLGSFRSNFGALQEQLVAARESAAELEQGLAERLGKLDLLPDPDRERAALDQRLGVLDELLLRAERLAGQVPAGVAHANELGAQLARLGELATRFESLHQTERTVGGQEELARLYERIQELAEGLAEGHAAPSTGRSPASEALEYLAGRFEHLSRCVETLVAEAKSVASAEATDQLQALARLERVAERLELAPAALPELPLGTIPDDGAAAQELEDFRVQLVFEQDSRRRTEGELESVRERLRASEMARVELETRHSTELAQMADHVGQQLRRVEDDLKKKKRGLAELTQQNIQLQNKLARLQAGADARLDPDAPPPALPRGGAAPRSPSRKEAQADGAPEESG